jgi:hypothetical protein
VSSHSGLPRMGTASTPADARPADRGVQHVERLPPPVVDAHVPRVALVTAHLQGHDARIQVRCATDIEQLVEGRADAEIRCRPGVRLLVELLGHQECRPQHGPFPAHLLQGHDRLRRPTHDRPHVDVLAVSPRIEADLRHVLDTHQVRQRLGHADRPRAHVRHGRGTLPSWRPARSNAGPRPTAGLGHASASRRGSRRRGCRRHQRSPRRRPDARPGLVQDVVVRASQARGR